MRKVSHLVEYAIFRGFSAFLLLLPLGWVQRMGQAFGRFTFKVLGFRRGVAVDNLTRAFPQYERGEILGIACRAFESVGISFFELLWVTRMSREHIRKLVRFENPDEVREVLSRRQGLILVTAHFGNWELCAQSFVAELGVPLYVVVKPQSNGYIDGQINRRRELFGNRAIPMSQAVKEISKALQEGHPIGIVGDQSAAKESLQMEFFGRKVPTHPGTAVLALRNQAPMMIGFTIRQPDGTYALRFDEVPTKDLTGYTPSNVETLTRRHVQLTEATIRQHPDQWMWMHRRWKHVPAAAEQTQPDVPR